jgi:uncharacterized protein (UPF0332 family)
VAIFNTDHLFEQADKLIAPRAGRPLQADVRRAIAAAYYGIFHAAITKAVDQFIGATNRGQSRYGLAYRSVDHKWLRELCKEVQKTTLSSRTRAYAPSSGFGANTRAFAEAVIELQDRRHAADYDVMLRMNRSDAALAVATARAALARFDEATQQERLAFLSLLLFRPR